MTPRHGNLVYFYGRLFLHEHLHPSTILWIVSVGDFIDIELQSSPMPDRIHAIKQVIRPHSMGIHLITRYDCSPKFLTFNHKGELSEISYTVTCIQRFNSLFCTYRGVRVKDPIDSKIRTIWVYPFFRIFSQAFNINREIQPICY